MMSARGGLFYAVDGNSYQSATNTILDLSRKVLIAERGGGPK